MSREFKQTDTSANAKMDGKQGDKEPSVPIKIPMTVLRWLIYSLWFSGCLAVWYPALVGYWGYISTCLVLGHFSSQLNAIINKK